MEEKKLKTLLNEFKDIDSYERIEIEMMLKARDLSVALFDIGQEIFRPARKHGYYEKEIEDLINACPNDENGYNIGAEIISKLENKFYAILQDRGIDHLIG